MFILAIYNSSELFSIINSKVYKLDPYSIALPIHVDFITALLLTNNYTQLSKSCLVFRRFKLLIFSPNSKAS